MRNEVRIFALDRIKMLHQTKETFEVPKDFSLEDFTGLSFGVYQGEPVHIKVWFHPDVAGYIKEKIWHESQKINPKPDGSIIFEAEVAGTDEIRFWIMTWGSKAEVLAPASLREEIRAEAEKVARQYESAISSKMTNFLQDDLRQVEPGDLNRVWVECLLGHSGMEKIWMPRKFSSPSSRLQNWQNHIENRPPDVRGLIPRQKSIPAKDLV